ncbi:TadE/TadG family type IV pilus assembly protein [Erythrobacter mangrovi]|uniref:Pilus assembly protein n=1 Tax=Erythrobacter mangrovi TaxID=2739433 RepID=A0A7D4BB65_9SPHN|nr:TadE/TadG family type IV pilus assembly protein [Erythrobacter mangrovi]QKG71961.1 pilus assembly protein [Erythrobacter mangrovi]
MITRLVRNERGSLGIEFAFAIPVLVALIIGIVQYGLILGANGSMRNAMGEGLRLAKVNPDATETAVLDRTLDSLTGVDPNGVETLTFSRGIVDNAETGTMTMTIKLTPIIPFAPISPIELTQTKTVYLPIGGAAPPAAAGS